ncbi:M48 family metallopeptidase [Arenibacterium sp. CAU 1754]
MTDHHLPGNPPVPLTLRRSGRARRISLRISHLDGRVTLTVPNRVAEREALEFARSKENWIRDHLSDRPDDVFVGFGALVPVEGRPRRIVPASGRRVVMSDDEIAVPEDRVGVRLQTWLRELARDRLARAADGYAGELGRPYHRLTLRDTRSRWGSCTSDGGLMFSWRLIMATPEVLNYVAAHEVAHLAEMNHSPAFWAVVERLYGPHHTARKWLRGEGSALHRYRFESAASK